MAPSEGVLGGPDGERSTRLSAFSDDAGNEVVDSQRGRTTYVHHN